MTKTLNTRNFAVAVATAFALIGATGSAIAQEAYPDTWVNKTVSTKTRAQVQAELQAALNDGSMEIWDIDYQPPTFKSVRTRAEVRAEAAQALRNGDIALINTPDYPYSSVAQRGTVRQAAGQ